MLVACGNGDTDAQPEGCGLPTPEVGVDLSIVPKNLLTEGAEIWRAQRERGGFIAAINTPLGVQDALKEYRTLVKDAGFEIIQEDNEGFEAEIYLRRRKRVAAIQIRTSQCDDASIVFINVVDPDELGGGVLSPSPSR